jgi:hypothetical protein
MKGIKTNECDFAPGHRTLQQRKIRNYCREKGEHDILGPMYD